MNTPKTPMEIEAKILGIIDDEYGHIRRPGVSAVKRAIALAYKQGDADRERIMREEASRGFDEYSTKEEHASWFSSVMNKQAGRHCWAAARADRAELVACVLEMAASIDVLEHIGGARSRAKDKWSDLINKLKAEKDTL